MNEKTKEVRSELALALARLSTEMEYPSHAANSGPVSYDDLLRIMGDSDNIRAAVDTLLWLVGEIQTLRDKNSSLDQFLRERGIVTRQKVVRR